MLTKISAYHNIFKFTFYHANSLQKIMYNFLLLKFIIINKTNDQKFNFILILNTISNISKYD